MRRTHFVSFRTNIMMSLAVSAGRRRAGMGGFSIRTVLPHARSATKRKRVQNEYVSPNSHRLVAIFQLEHLGVVGQMIIRSLKIYDDRADVEVVGNGNTYRFALWPIKGSQLLSGQFVAAQIREGRAGIVTRWVAPSMVMAQGVKPAHICLELERNRRWFRELMARIIFAK
jgi:hypothetical protein